MKSIKLLMTPELDDAIQTALKQPTLVDALSSIALWEHSRITAEIRAGEPTQSYFRELINVIVHSYVWTERDTSVIHLPKMDG